MRATLQNKRTGGRCAANHIDRTFDVAGAENISADYKQKDKVFLFQDGSAVRSHLGTGAVAKHEREYYYKTYGPHQQEQREKYLSKRQKKRAEGCTTDALYNNRNTAPVECILQVGAGREFEDVHAFAEMVSNHVEYIQNFAKEDARITVLSVAFHNSETALHAHMRYVFEIKDENGNWIPSQEECLKRLGIQLPKDTPGLRVGKEKRYNNRMMTFTEDCKNRWYDTVDRVAAVTIERTPAPAPIRNKGRARKAIFELKEVMELLKGIEASIEALNANIDQLSKEEVKKRTQELQKALKNANRVFGKVKDKYELKKDIETVEEAIEAVEDMDMELEQGL